jgi:hypothetical protein
MYYNWHRYYDSKHGRYRQSDPIGVAGGLNLYAYAGGNALSFSDAIGLSPKMNFWDKVWKNYDETDQGISSLIGDGLSGVLGEPIGEVLGNHYKTAINFATSSTTATWLKVPTAFEWVLGGGYRIPGLYYGTITKARLVSGFRVFRSTGVNFLLAQGAWRGGILLGSIFSVLGDELLSTGGDNCEEQ